MIKVFGFNTTNGGMFEMHDTTVEEIRAALKERFPKWSDTAIERAINNQSYYKAVIPMNKEPEKKVIKRGSISKESICINGFELNPILSLGQSIHMYGKNGYRYWGHVIDRLMNHPHIASVYGRFEQKYDNVVVSIKSRPMANKQEITRNVIEMCDCMDELKKAFDKTGLLQQDSDKEYICGNGKKLGMGELMKRVGEMSSDCSAALK